jgi:hypothetical protein
MVQELSRGRMIDRMWNETQTKIKVSSMGQTDVKDTSCRISDGKGS